MIGDPVAAVRRALGIAADSLRALRRDGAAGRPDQVHTEAELLAQEPAAKAASRRLVDDFMEEQIEMDAFVERLKAEQSDSSAQTCQSEGAV